MQTFARSHPILAGALVGLTWGVVMRAWMRFISTSPEFSWSGTLFIIGASVIAGSLLGFARLRRWRLGVGWWRFTVLALVLLGAGGAVMWPAVILGAIAIGRRRPTWLVGVLGLAALATQWPALSDAVFDNWRMDPTEKVLGVVWYLPMLTLEAWGFSVVFAPRLSQAPIPTRLKAALIGVPVAGLALVAVLAMGIQM
ncbi:MAG TPA: hypothetical protein VIY70_06205 [Acidimicrobiia bacterium]